MPLHSPARQRRTRRFGKVKDALDYSGISRSRLYQWGARRPDLFRKNGRASIVDFDVLDDLLDGLPPAKIAVAVRGSFNDAA